MHSTEAFSPRYKGLDTWSDGEVLSAMLDSQTEALAAVRPALGAIAAAAQAVAARLRTPGSRLAYAGAGTSGLLAALDGMELTPTFAWPPERLVLLMAGGDQARLRPSGGGEDDAAAARRDAARHALGGNDAVIAVVASGTTPYTVALVEAARHGGALTVGVANNASSALLLAAEHAILIDTGPEVIAGSTRLKAGTAQKVVLNLLSSLVMTRLGHVVDGLMVSMVADNEKLRARAVRMVAEIAEVDASGARDALNACAGRVKEAVLVARGASATQARDTLERCAGDLRAALARCAP